MEGSRRVDASPSAPQEDSDHGYVSPGHETEIEPEPGLHGVPVRWYDADRKEPYTQIEPFSEKRDTSVEFFFHPFTLSALAFGISALAYVATTNDVLEEGKDKRRLFVLRAAHAEVCLIFFQWGVRGDHCLPHVFYDSISRWSICPATPCILEDRPWRKFTLRAGPRVPPIPRLEDCATNDDIH